jgi:hypothetical protein
VKLILGLAALPLLAQTTITPPQIRLGAPGEPANLRLYAVGLSGMVQVQVGPGLRIELREGVPTLTADPGALRIVSRVLVQDQNGNYVCPPCERVYRNGIRQAFGVDYNTNPGGVLPIQPWAADDVVLGEWIGTEPSAYGPEPPGAVPGPTIAGFRQVRNWAMLRNSNSKGTSITLDQLPMPRDVADLWRRHAARPVYDEYRVAVVPDQDYPILITCGAWGCDRSAALWYRPGG